VEDPADHERRKHRRFSLRLAAVVAVGSDQRLERGELIEMSAGGASLSVGFPVAVETAAYIRFLSPQGRECEATGQVVRAMPFGRTHGIALEFRFVNTALDEFLATLEATQQALRPDLLAQIRELRIQVA
jgi:hypothetical protein